MEACQPGPETAAAARTALAGSAEEPMTDAPDLRAPLAFLKATAADDEEAVHILLDHDERGELAAGLAYVCLLFISEVANPISHLDQMFRAVEVAELSGRDR